MTIASQYSPTLTKTSIHLHPLAWILPPILSSYFSLLSLHHVKNALSQRRLLTRRLQLCKLPTIPELQYTTPLFINWATVLNFLPKHDHPVTTQELPSFNSLLSDVGYLLSRPDHLKFEPDPSTLASQHCHENYINRSQNIKRPCFNHHLLYSVKLEFFSEEIVIWPCRRQEFTIQTITFPTICSATTSHFCITSLMSLYPLAPIVLPQLNSLPALTASLGKLASVHPHLLSIDCAMPSLTELSFIFDVKTPNFDATTQRDHS